MLRGLFRAAFFLLLGVLLFSVGWVALYRVVDPPATFLTLRDRAKGVAVSRTWRPLDEMAGALPRAMIAAEDSKFCLHHGFDFDSIRQAREANERGSKLRGGSTITQQTAKNVFLWPGRTMTRKAVEAWFSFLIERLWGKRRIMEVYLNVAEMGQGVFGAEAGARHYFGKPAADLSVTEAARLAAIMPQPITRSASAPGPFTRRYASQIVARMRIVRRDGLDSCLSS